MLEKKILETIKKNKLIEKNDKIVIGVSGGPDSVCLLFSLNNLSKELEIKLVVAHINHLIRVDSNLDEKYVESLCKDMGIEFFSKQIDVEKIAKEKKQSIELTGREVRHEFFEEVRKKTDSNKVATAHNANDQTETVLLNILRGTRT